MIQEASCIVNHQHVMEKKLLNIIIIIILEYLCRRYQGLLSIAELASGIASLHHQVQEEIMQTLS